MSRNRFQFNRLHYVSDNDSVADIRQFCQHNHLNVKLNGRGRRKEHLIADTNVEVDYWLDKLTKNRKRAISKLKDEIQVLRIILALGFVAICVYTAFLIYLLAQNLNTSPTTWQKPNARPSLPKLNKTYQIPSSFGFEPSGFEPSGFEPFGLPAMPKLPSTVKGGNPIKNQPDDNNEEQENIADSLGDLANKIATVTVFDFPTKEYGSSLGGSGDEITYEDFNKNQTILQQKLDEIVEHWAHVIIRSIQFEIKFEELTEQDIKNWQQSLQNDIAKKFSDLFQVDIHEPANNDDEIVFYNKQVTYSYKLEPDVLRKTYQLTLLVAHKPKPFMSRKRSFRIGEWRDIKIYANQDYRKQFESSRLAWNFNSHLAV